MNNDGKEIDLEELDKLVDEGVTITHDGEQLHYVSKGDHALAMRLTDSDPIQLSQREKETPQTPNGWLRGEITTRQLTEEEKAELDAKYPVRPAKRKPIDRR
jgi:hypothetical protein